MERYFDINDGGYSVRCKLYCTDLHNIKKVVIFGHGFGGHKDNKAAAKFAERINTKYKGFAVVTFDWPCHGEDALKKLTLGECDSYLSLVLSYIKEHYKTEELYCYATSFGGYLVLKYISEHGNPFRKVALRCPAVNMYESLTNTIMKNDELEKLGKGKEVMVGFDRKVRVTKAFLEDVKANDIRKLEFLDFADDILILHGTKDEVIPFAESSRFAEDNVIEMIPVENADHRFIDPKKMDYAIQMIISFFAGAEK